MPKAQAQLTPLSGLPGSKLQFKVNGALFG